MKLAILFRRIGPYHRARLEAIGQLAEVCCVEGSGKDTVYAWDRVDAGASFQRLTLFPNADSGCVPQREVWVAVARALDRIDPEVVVIPGWHDKLAWAGLLWATKTGKPVVVMSESNENDAQRQWFKERIKRHRVQLCAAGLVGGSASAHYLARLGLDKDRIFWGYDAVDNNYFTRKAAEVRSQKSEVRSQLGLPDNYFLASARFVEKKNLSCLLQAYARYRSLWDRSEGRSQKAEMDQTSSHLPPSTSQPWSLVILGDGPLRSKLSSQLSTLHLQPFVALPGFKQYDELPMYYGLASAFVHASTVEQWGLVVNEAMASGLPVLVSNRCGCAPDLVQSGINGFTFDPGNVDELAGLMLQLSKSGARLSAFGTASKDIIRRWSPEVFAENLGKAVQVAVSKPRPQVGWIDLLLLWGLLNLRR